MRTTPQVALVGVHGFGRVHLDQLIRLAGEGRIEIAGLADQRAPDEETLAALPGVPFATDAGALLAKVRPDITVVATPIHTHLPLARHALAAGSHLLVEKPPTGSLAQFRALVAEVAEAGRVCQVGFQSHGSFAVAHAARQVADGTLGPLRGIGAHGAWIRDETYFGRAPWAGRMELGTDPVTDGALTNAFAHATATALRVLGAPADAAVSVELERYRAMSPEGDDTAAARVTVDGVPIVVAVTLCAQTSRDPLVVVHGERGRLELGYTTDTLAGAPAGRIGLLENLLDHLADRTVPLVSPLAGSEPFMKVLEAVRLDGPARPLPDSVRLDAGTRTVAVGADDAVRRCAEELLLFSEVGWPT